MERGAEYHEWSRSREAGSCNQHKEEKADAKDDDSRFDGPEPVDKTPAGQYTISAKTAPSDAAVGDEVSLWLNDENMVIDHHGKEKHMKGTHRLIFGKLNYDGKTKNQIKLQTPEGEKVFSLERMEVKTKPIAEGSQIVVELNEEGTVIDLRKAQ
jgi:hypothetical protein